MGVLCHPLKNKGMASKMLSRCDCVHSTNVGEVPLHTLCRSSSKLENFYVSIYRADIYLLFVRKEALEVIQVATWHVWRLLQMYHIYV